MLSEDLFGRPMERLSALRFLLLHCYSRCKSSAVSLGGEHWLNWPLLKIAAEATAERPLQRANCENQRSGLPVRRARPGLQRQHTRTAAQDAGLGEVASVSVFLQFDGRRADIQVLTDPPG